MGHSRREYVSEVCWGLGRRTDPACACLPHAGPPGAGSESDRRIGISFSMVRSGSTVVGRMHSQLLRSLDVDRRWARGLASEGGGDASEWGESERLDDAGSRWRADHAESPHSFAERVAEDDFFYVSTSLQTSFR